MSTPEKLGDEDYQLYLWGEACPRGFAKRALVAPRRLRVEVVAQAPHGIPA